MAGFRDATADAVEQATEAAARDDRECEASLERCLKQAQQFRRSKDHSPKFVPSANDVELVRHYVIRGRTLHEGGLRAGSKCKLDDEIRCILKAWRDLADGRFDVDPVFNCLNVNQTSYRYQGGGHRELWKSIKSWARSECNNPADQAGADADAATGTHVKKKYAVTVLVEAGISSPTAYRWLKEFDDVVHVKALEQLKVNARETAEKSENRK